MIGVSDRSVKMVSDSESSCATERSYEVRDFCPAPSPDMEDIEEGSVVEVNGPERQSCLRNKHLLMSQEHES